MEDNKEKKRKTDAQNDDDDYRKERKSKRARTRSRSPRRDREDDTRRKRKHSRSGSRERPVKQERQRDEQPKQSEVRKEVPERKTKEPDMLNTRTGGAYIPPARLRLMQALITDKSSVPYQRLAWEALKKSIHGHINKINVGNIGIIIKELLKENIVRGRGLLSRSIIQAQAASPTFTNVYAALVSAVNSRFPNIGELLLKRLVIQFKRGFKRNDKATCISSASFIAHLVNQRVAHEILALELLTLLVETPTDDSVEVAIAFLKECGQKLTEVSSKGVNAIFEMLRNILHEGQLDKRVQYMIEVMFQVWKDGFKDHPALIEELELVPEEDQFTHLLMLDDATDPQDILNVFKFDEKFEENEQKYKTLSKEILGSDAESEGEEGSGGSGSDESDEEDAAEGDGEEKPMTIIDNTETNLVALRRTIYLTINSSLDFEECAHKLMKMQLKPGQEVELCHMFLDCCAEQRTYEKFYGLLAQRFCNINRIYIAPFEEIFRDSYSTAHRLDTNRLRNVSKFFAHLLITDSINWDVLECVKLNEEDTTSSSRIYIKILFQELAEFMGLKKLNDRLKDATLQIAFQGIFPRDNPKNTRFSINFFTSIGLGGLTDELREHLKQMPKNVPAPLPEITLNSESSSDSSSSSSSEDSSSDSSSSDSDSGEETNKKKGDKKTKSKKDAGKDKTPKTPTEESGSGKKDPERWDHGGFYDTYGKDARRVDSRDNRKSKRDEERDKTPRTPPGDGPSVQKQQDRWGHDGFYENYGKDARRFDSRPERKERDKDSFVRPRDVRRNDDYRGRNNDFEQRFSNSRSEEHNRRYADRTRIEDDDSRRKNRDDDRRDDRDRRPGDKGEARNNRRAADEDRRRDVNLEDSRYKRSKDVEESRSNKEKDSRNRKDDTSRSNKDIPNEDNRRKSDKEDKRKDKNAERYEDEPKLRNRQEHDVKQREQEKSENDNRKKKDKTRDERIDKRIDLEATTEEGNKRKGDKYKANSSKKEAQNKHRKQFSENSDEDTNKQSDKDKKRDSRKPGEEKYSKKSNETSSKRNRREKHTVQVSSDEEVEKENKNKKNEGKNKKEKKRGKRTDKSDSSDSSDSSGSSDSSDSSDSSEDDSRKKHRRKGSDDWDIRRASSLRREISTTRYWDR